MPQPEETSSFARLSGNGSGARQQADSMVAKAAPHNIDAEEALLACCLIDAAETLSLCQEKGLRPDAFYRPAHQVLFATIEQLHARNEDIDQISLADHLNGRTVGTLPGRERDPDAGKNLFEYLGGHELLNRITSRIESTVHARVWLDIVFEKWVLRRLIRAATNVVEGCSPTKAGSTTSSTRSSRRFSRSVRTACRTVPCRSPRASMTPAR